MRLILFSQVLPEKDTLPFRFRAECRGSCAAAHFCDSQQRTGKFSRTAQFKRGDN
ncbi:hypothetical protein CLOSTMETH_03719 [[Clostridium] methylpentosum DSM 5476]|uniref:Uncharacterized protein n=1 Tax=[Clostridium] methylpentosum DSM 5476 TaxID=537013 RepID=C0EIM4_9FIRM|nr:hypothetical protein CLOSTMETH_03719 [[Clostridium] methylpentosum DSM 5476]